MRMLSIKDYQIIKNTYGIKLAILKLLQEIAQILHFNLILYFIAQRKHKVVKEYLCNKYSDIIIKYSKQKNLAENNVSSGNERIWTFWWQGEEQAPEVIKICFSGMRKNANGRSLVVITKENYKNWIELPPCILNKVKSETISLTHLSDIIRMILLSVYGGLWLDATILAIKPIPDELFNYGYYTAKQRRKACLCVSDYRWTGSFISGKNTSIIFKFMSEAFNEYWKNEDVMIDYFLIDYWMDIAYEKIPAFRQQIDEVPLNNINMYDLEQLMNLKYNELSFCGICKGGLFFKLQRRNEYVKQKLGSQTLYGYLTKRYL